MAGNFAEFGPEESGARLADLDHQKDMVAGLQGLMHLATTQEVEARLPLIQAEARKAGVEADTLEQKLTIQRRIADLMANRGDPLSGGTNKGNIAYDMAGIYAAAGDYDTASKLQLRGTQAEANVALVDYRKNQSEAQQLIQLRQSASLVGSMASGVTDQPSYDRFLASAQAAHLNVANLPMDYASAKPALSELVTQGMTVKQWVDSQQATRNAEEKRKVDASLVRARAASAAANDARTKLITQRLKDAIKNGGEKSAEALALLQERTKLTKAREQLINTQTSGQSYENPRPLPLAGGKADASKLKEGQFYSNSAGQIGRWNGSAMELVQAPRKTAPIAASPSNDDSEILGDDDADED